MVAGCGKCVFHWFQGIKDSVVLGRRGPHFGSRNGRRSMPRSVAEWLAQPGVKASKISRSPWWSCRLFLFLPGASLCVDDIGRQIPQSLVGPPSVVAFEPFFEPGLQRRQRRVFAQVDLFVFQASPQPLDEHVVHPSTPPVHTDPHSEFQ